MTDPRQPMTVPVIAGDLTATSTYSSGPSAGVLALAMPSVGALAAGLTTDQSWFGAQSFNAVMQSYGMHIEALADMPTFTLTHPVADTPGDQKDYCTPSGDGTSNTNGVLDSPLIQATGSYVVAQLGHKSTAVGAGVLRRWRQSSHKGLSQEADQTPINPTTTPGPFTEGASAGDTPMFATIPAIIGTDVNSSNILSLGNGRTVKLSTNDGATWTTATSLPFDGTWSSTCFAFAMGTQWVVLDSLTLGSLNRLVTSADLTAAVWTIRGTFGGANSGLIRRATWSNSIAVFLPQSNTLFGYWRPGDAAVTGFRLGGIAADSTRNGWRGAYNSMIGMFLIGNAQGDLWTSLDGISWAQIAANAAGLSVRDIVAHGRGFVISNSSTTWEIDYLDFDRKATYRIRRLYKGIDQSQASGFHLARHGGRWYGARVINVPAGLSNSYLLEWVYSDVHPWDKNNAVGR